MNVAISNTSEKPIYQQLFKQLSSQIIKEELDRCRLIYTVTGRGCFVTDSTSKERLQKRNEMVVSQMSEDLNYYKALGLSVDEIIELLKLIY